MKGYLIWGSWGVYEERTEWVVPVVYTDEEVAQKHIDCIRIRQLELDLETQYRRGAVDLGKMSREDYKTWRRATMPGTCGTRPTTGRQTTPSWRWRSLRGISPGR